MGAAEFLILSPGTDAVTAFNTARILALEENGAGLYTGTIAEKRTFVVIDNQPCTRQDAVRRARQLLREDDARIASKWGPCAAIRVALDDGGSAWLFFGLAPE